MCGIFGIIKLKGYKKANNLKVLTTFRKIALASKSRGTDASGVACVVNKKMQVLKSAEPIDDLIESKEYKEFETLFDKTRIMIGHTRAKTRGTPKDNKNNHPVFNKDKTAVVTHNGMIHNRDELVKSEKLKLQAEVDSEAIIGLWDKYEGNYDEVITRLQGSFAFAILDEKTPTKLALYKHSNPIFFGWCKKWNAVFYASDDDFIKDALKHTQMQIFDHYETECIVSSADNNTLYLINTNNSDLVDIKKSIEPMYYYGYSTTTRSRFGSESTSVRKITHDTTQNAYDENDNIAGINELFSNRSKLAHPVCLMNEAFLSADDNIILTKVHPFFLDILKRHMKQWKDLYLEDKVEIRLNDDGYSLVKLTPNPEVKSGQAGKTLSKIISVLETNTLMKSKNIQERCKNAMDKQLQKIDAAGETDENNDISEIQPLFPNELISKLNFTKANLKERNLLERDATDSFVEAEIKITEVEIEKIDTENHWGKSLG